MKRAPKKLSTAMRLALHDLALVERSKKYKVNMGHWHGPEFKRNKYTGENAKFKYCEVCFAGSVMAKTMRVDPVEEVGPGHFASEWYQIFMALNYARTGAVGLALTHMGRGSYVADELNIPEYVPYEKNKKQWRKDMWKIVRELEKVGE